MVWMVTFSKSDQEAEEDNTHAENRMPTDQEPEGQCAWLTFTIDNPSKGTPEQRQNDNVHQPLNCNHAPQTRSVSREKRCDKKRTPRTGENICGTDKNSGCEEVKTRAVSCSSLAARRASRGRNREWQGAEESIYAATKSPESIQSMGKPWIAGWWQGAQKARWGSWRSKQMRTSQNWRIEWQRCFSSTVNSYG